jgi:enoyl-CoA hydratase/carnithine racemase
MNMSPSPSFVRRQDEADVAVLTLADAPSRNSLSEAMLVALADAFNSVDTDRAVKCVILAADGPVFCSGHHLKEMQAHRNDLDGGRAHVSDLLARCSRLMMSITRLRTPVIAAVEGLATAAGCQLVASCDLVIAGAEARFCTPGANLGLFCSTPAVALGRSVAPKHAMEMLLTGEMIDAETAVRFGLANHRVEKGKALGAAMSLARRIASRSDEAIAFGKPAFYDQLSLPLEAAYEATSRVMVDNFMAGQAKEGIGSFLEKREPRWT